jgi:hypothetical protein
MQDQAFPLQNPTVERDPFEKAVCKPDEKQRHSQKHRAESGGHKGNDLRKRLHLQSQEFLLRDLPLRKKHLRGILGEKQLEGLAERFPKLLHCGKIPICHGEKAKPESVKGGNRHHVQQKFGDEEEDAPSHRGSHGNTLFDAKGNDKSQDEEIRRKEGTEQGLLPRDLPPDHNAERPQNGKHGQSPVQGTGAAHEDRARDPRGAKRQKQDGKEGELAEKANGDRVQRNAKIQQSNGGRAVMGALDPIFTHAVLYHVKLLSFVQQKIPFIIISNKTRFVNTIFVFLCKNPMNSTAKISLLS